MVTAAPTLAEVSESTLLATIFPFFPGGAAVAVGPGDDAAVLATGRATVATTDSMVRGRDWLDTWSSAGDVATKLLTQNLADVAAMGADSDGGAGLAGGRPADADRAGRSTLRGRWGRGPPGRGRRRRR